MASLEDWQLLGLALDEFPVPTAELLRRVVRRFSGRLAGEPDQHAMLQDLRSLSFILRKRTAAENSSKKTEEKELGAVAQEVAERVCEPCLALQLQEAIESDWKSGLRTTADVIAALLLRPELPAETAVWLLSSVHGAVENQRESGAEGVEKSAFLLTSLFTCSTPEQLLQLIPACGPELTSMFSLLLSLLTTSPPATCHLLCCSVLPLFISPPSPLPLLTAVWVLVGDVWSGRRLVELHPLAFSLTVLCCFSDVLIGREPASPFTTSFPATSFPATTAHPLLDVRTEGVLWAVLGVGLRSGDPLDRKRAMYLLHR